jgi:hypothetical protein
MSILFVAGCDCELRCRCCLPKDYRHEEDGPWEICYVFDVFCHVKKVRLVDENLQEGITG